MTFSHEKFYYVIDLLSIILYISLITGLGFINPVFIGYFDKFIKLYISGYLLYRFFPYGKNKSLSITKSDQNIIFNAGIYLLLSIIPFERFFEDLKFSKKNNPLDKSVPNA
jgi:hypothetical protein